MMGQLFPVLAMRVFECLGKLEAAGKKDTAITTATTIVTHTYTVLHHGSRSNIINLCPLAACKEIVKRCQASLGLAWLGHYGRVMRHGMKVFLKACPRESVQAKIRP